MLFSPVNITFLIQKPEKSMKKLPLNSQVMDISFYPTKKKQFCNHAQIWFAVKNGVPGLSVHRFKDTVITSLDWVDSLKLSWEKLNQAFFNPIIKLVILAAFNLRESMLCHAVSISGTAPPFPTCSHIWISSCQGPATDGTEGRCVLVLTSARGGDELTTFLKHI